MKRVILVVLGVTVVLVAAAAIAVSRIDPETMRSYLISVTKESTGKPLYLAQAPQLSIMPLGVTFGAASWGMVEDKPAAEGLSVAVKGGNLKLQILPLLSGRLVVDEVRLDSPQVTVRPEKKAVVAPESPEQPPFAFAKQLEPLELTRLSIANGSALLDMGQGQVLRIEGFNASVTDLRPGGEAAVKLDLACSNTQPDIAGNLAFATHVRLNATGVQLRQTKMTFTQVRGPLASAAGTVHMSLDAALTGETAKLENIKVSLGGASLSGTLQVGLGRVPSITGALQIDDLNADTLLAPAKAASTPKAQTPSAPRTNLDSEYPKVDLDMRLKGLTVQKLPIKQAHALVRGEGGKAVRYTVDPFTVEIGTGGTLQSKASIEVPLMRFGMDGRLQSLAVGPLMQAAKGSRPVDGMAEAEYAITCAGQNGAAIMGNLSGKGNLTVRNIVLNGITLLPQNAPVQGLPTRFESLQVPFTAQNGIVSVNGMTLTGEGLSANGKGVVRLPQQNMDATAVIKTLGMQIPVQVSGPFANLSYGVDPKWAAKALMQAPGALVEGGKNAGGKAGDAAKGLGGTVKGLFGR